MKVYKQRNINISIVNIVISSIIIMALVISSFFYLQSRDNKIFNDFISEINLTQKKSEHVYKLDTAAYKRGYVQYQMILTEDPFERDDYSHDYHKFGYEVGFHRQKLLELIETSEEKAILDDQQELIRKTLDIQVSIEDALANDDLKLAGSIRQKAYAEGLFEDLFSNLNKLLDIQETKETNLLIQAKENFKETSETAFVLIAVVVILIVLISFYVIYKLKSEAIIIKNVMSDLDESNKKHIYLSFHDLLTGLANRAKLYEQLSENLTALKKNDGKLNVLFFDLDGFKKVNDTLGHDAGDQLLKEISVRLTNNLPDSLFISRIGGDEFVVLSNQNEQKLKEAAQLIIDLLRKPFKLEAGIANIGTSIGISQYKKDGQTADELLNKADTAMYVAKLTNGNTYHFANEKDSELIKDLKHKAVSRRS